MFFTLSFPSRKFLFFLHSNLHIGFEIELRISFFFFFFFKTNLFQENSKIRDRNMGKPEPHSNDGLNQGLLPYAVWLGKSLLLLIPGIYYLLRIRFREEERKATASNAYDAKTIRSTSASSKIGVILALHRVYTFFFLFF